MRTKQAGAVIAAVVIVAVAAYAGYSYYGSGRPTPLIVYSADAYVAESNAMLSGYHNASGFSVLKAKGGGSFTDAREIGQGDPANAFISVSKSSYNQSYLKARYSGWAIAFASDQLVLAYSNSSDTKLVNSIVGQFSNALRDNSSALYMQAYENLTSGKVKVGISNPSTDPAGLRGWISLEIAGKLYANNETRFTSAIKASNGATNDTSAAELVSPLSTGNIQFLFIYRSAAISDGLPYVELPQYTNFGNASLSGFYSSFSYSTATGPESGSPVLLLVTSLAGNGPDTAASLNFTVYVATHSSEMAPFGLLPFAKPLLFNGTSLPAPILALLDEGKITQAGTI